MATTQHWTFDWRYRLILIVIGIQILLIPAYRSTDFEVHRNWLAITYRLPINKWYYEATSEWTLDYPPFFAWFEWALAQFAQFFDKQMLVVSNPEYASDATVAFQRLSVTVTSLVLAGAVLYATKHDRDNVKGLTLTFLIMANAGLIMVDNIHFQYNSILLGVLVWSILMAEQHQDLASGALFAFLLNLKHLFAYVAPVYFVYLLRHYCMCAGEQLQHQTAKGSSSSSSRCDLTWNSCFVRLAKLGGLVVLIFAASFGPFIAMGQLPQVLSRLFPFARGLCHAYWAPNAWALYSAADKVLAAVLARAGLISRSGMANMAGGIVGVSEFVVLPQVGARATAALTLLAMAPCLAALWRNPRPKALAQAVAYANLCGFMLGYHVHEKAALTVLIPLALPAVREPHLGSLFMILSTAAHVGIFPLLFQLAELPIRWALAGLYYLGALWGLGLLHGGGKGVKARPRTTTTTTSSSSRGGGWCPFEPWWLPWWHRVYLAGFVPLELYCSLGHSLVFGERLPFVPLMLTSVYCALGMSFGWCCILWGYIQEVVEAQGPSSSR